MDLLSKQLANKENQFREMSAQLVNHLKRISVLSAEVKEVRSGNAVLQGLIEEKDEYLAKLLKEKLELFETLERLEKPEVVEKLVETVEKIEGIESQEKVLDREDVKDEEIQLKKEEKEEEGEGEGEGEGKGKGKEGGKDKDKEKVKEEAPKIEIKEEPYISDEIDITAELEKLGLVDLIKKY